MRKRVISMVLVAAMALTGISSSTVVFASEYEGTVGTPVIIEGAKGSEDEKMISDENVSVGESFYVGDGKWKTPDVTVEYEGTILTRGEDYTIRYDNNVDAGTAAVIVEGIGEYSGTVRKTYTIRDLSAEGFDIHISNLNNQGITLFSYTGDKKEVVIPDGVETIWQGTFSRSNVTSITLPASLRTIYRSVGIPGHFRGCDNLEEIKVDNENQEYASEDGILYSKDKTVLWCCPSKKSGTLDIRANVRVIDTYELQGRHGINEIRVDNENQEYASEDGILYSKDKATLICCPAGKSGTLDIPASVTTLSAYAFSGCSGLTGISIPASVTTICQEWMSGDSGYKLISGCTGLKELKIDSSNPSYASEDGILYDKDKTNLLCCLPGKSGTVTIPGSVTNIEVGAFSGCSGLTGITIPESVTSIGDGPFVDQKAFSDCGEELVIYGKSGSYAETYAKENNIKFSPVETTGKQTISDNNVSLGQTSYAYDGKDKRPAVTVKNGNIVLKAGIDYAVTYENNKNAGTAKVIVNGKGNYDGTVTKTFTITVKKGTSHKVGTYQYKVTGASIAAITGICNKKTTKIKIPQTVQIGGKVFKVTAIGNKAFRKNAKITSVEIGDNVETIGASAFEGCAKLNKVTVGSGVKKVGANAWKGCKKLGTVTIKSAKLKSIGKNALKGIKSNAKIRVPAKKLSAYQKLLKNKGQGKKVKILK